MKGAAALLAASSLLLAGCTVPLGGDKEVTIGDGGVSYRNGDDFIGTYDEGPCKVRQGYDDSGRGIDMTCDAPGTAVVRLAGCDHSEAGVEVYPEAEAGAVVVDVAADGEPALTLRVEGEEEDGDWLPPAEAYEMHVRLTSAFAGSALVQIGCTA